MQVQLFNGQTIENHDFTVSDLLSYHASVIEKKT